MTTCLLCACTDATIYVHAAGMAVCSVCWRARQAQREATAAEIASLAQPLDPVALTPRKRKKRQVASEPEQAMSLLDSLKKRPA